MNEKIVDPALYDNKYFLSDNDGWREWEAGLETCMHSKFRRALELAGPIAGKKVLDIGCGRGELIYYCVKNGASALGIDYSPDAIAIANLTIDRLPPNLKGLAKAAVGNAESYNFNETYDIVFMIEVAEHIYDWQLRDTIAKIKNILNPGGRIVIMTPNYYYEKWLSPAKRILNIPFNLFKWPLRIARGKYQPKSFRELSRKIFRIHLDRNDLNKKMHVNVTTRGTLKSHLKDFDTKVWCRDNSKNILSIITAQWCGRDLEAIAVKK